MNGNVQQIAWAIEERIMSNKVRNSPAIKAIRNAKCLRDDFRTYSALSEVFNYLTAAFKKSDGMIMLANTCMSTGDIYARNLDIEASAQLKMKLGVEILNPLIDNDYLILDRDPFFTFEEIKIGGVLKTLRLQPYHLERGPNFDGGTPEKRERIGISETAYPKWEGLLRMVDGIRDRKLIKSSIKSIETNAPYLKAINNLEQVRWEINESVAEVSVQLADSITETAIQLHTADGECVSFDTRDIRRLSLNKEYASIKLFKDGTLFEPHRGNHKTVETLEKELTAQEKRADTLKVGGKTHTKCLSELKTLHRLFETHNQRWIAKQLCLATQSKAGRDRAILETIHGLHGWKGYQFHLGMFLDFRGRVYARDAFFSYQSSDLARGHLQFAEKKLMTDKGFKYLLIHAANSFNKSYSTEELKSLEWTTSDYVSDLVKDGIPDLSLDKMSLIDRQRWAEENTELFWDIAEDPMAHLELWINAEKPWVFLSLCFEIAAYQGSLLTGEDYYSRIPVAIDGSANGTQHLAAMSLDHTAGAMVGLIPQEKPIDFYIVIAKGILGRNVENDLGDLLRDIPMKLIRKGISKRGTMTKAYDAGVSCIADIIYKDCYDAGMTTKYGITKQIAKRLSKDLVTTYNTVCEGPVAIKDYLQALVEYNMKELGNTQCAWVTPSGFPVISERWIKRKHLARLSFTGKEIGLVIHEYTDKPAVHEVISGISPNWVHSMDASHMSLVINYLNDLGIVSFGAIHDSFSVHAEDVEKLLDITKSVFISMYDVDMFKMMRTEIISDDLMFALPEPQMGKLDLQLLRKSDYFFC